jgi:hypothetical protein
MRADRNSETSGLTGIPSRTTTQAPDRGRSDLTLSTADRLGMALAQTPAGRAEKVMEARKLVRDVSYPGQELIDKLSAFLAFHMDSKRTIATLCGAKARRGKQDFEG